MNARLLRFKSLTLVVAVMIGPVVPARARVISEQQTASRAEQETVEVLRSRISAHISSGRFAAASWGISIVSLDTGLTVFEQNSGKYFSPASNAKLYTAALALDSLGPDYRIRTSLYASSRPDAFGTLRGDLIVYGRGDPTMAARLNGGDYYQGLEPLVEALVAAGVKRIRGDLIGDESFFRGPRFGSGWEWDDLQWYYGAEVSALSVNDNAVDLFVRPAARAGMPCVVTTGPATSLLKIVNRVRTSAAGSRPGISVYRPVGENTIYLSGELPKGGTGYTGFVAVSDPAKLFITMFRELLSKRGIVVQGKTSTVDWQGRGESPLPTSELAEIGYVLSPPLGEIVREVLKPSQNLWAQLLLLQVGAMHESRLARAPSSSQAASRRYSTEGITATTRPRVVGSQRPEPTGGGGSRRSEAGTDRSAPSFSTTEEAGIDALTAFVSSTGIEDGSVVLEEGSGLSRRDLITPAATVELLTFMSGHESSSVFVEAMPVAGVDGTLQNRMKDTLAAANVRAKTGTLRYVNNLAGYVTTASGERLAFAIMLNNYNPTDRSVRARDEVDAIAVMLATFAGRSKPAGAGRR